MKRFSKISPTVPLIVIREALAVVTELDRNRTDANKSILSASTVLTKIIKSEPCHGDGKSVPEKLGMIVRFPFAMEDGDQLQYISNIWAGDRPPKVNETVVLSDVRKSSGRGYDYPLIAIGARPLREGESDGIQAA